LRRHKSGGGGGGKGREMGWIISPVALGKIATKLALNAVPSAYV
jgi:hypothetical protein